MAQNNLITISQFEGGQINIDGSIFITIVKKVLSESNNIKVGENFFEKIKQKIKITIDNDKQIVTIDLPITVIYGENIVKISKEIQNNIKEEILILLDFKQVIVNIYVDQIVIEK